MLNFARKHSSTSTAVCSTCAPNWAYFIVTAVIIIIIISCSQDCHKTSRDCTVITHCHVRTHTMTSPHSKHTCTHLTSKMSKPCSTRLHSYNVFSVVKISYLVYHLLCWVGKINQASYLCFKQPPKTLHDTHSSAFPCLRGNCRNMRVIITQYYSPSKAQWLLQHHISIRNLCVFATECVYVFHTAHSMNR